MKRRKFFQTASYGTVGLAMAASCKHMTTGSEGVGTGSVNKEAPAYRKTFKTTYIKGFKTNRNKIS